jgi:recombinational DNA repair ATPase RecF
MRLERLSLLNFKNITECELLPSEGINCIVGSNGAGKTNVVDAIHYLSMSKSSLPMTDGQSVLHGTDFFMLSGDYTTDGDMGVTVTCGFKKGGGKSLKFCGKEYERLADHIGVVPVVMVSPSDGALVVEAAEERRRWLNAFISQLDRTYLDATMRYNRILAERNTLLKQGECMMPELLDILDERLAEQGEKVAATRRDVLSRLAPIVERLYAAIAGAARGAGHVCAPSLWQKVIARCTHLRPDLAAYEKNRQALYEGLISMGYEVAKPDGAFYLFVKAPGGDANEFSDLAKKKDLLLVPGDGFGCPGYFRICYCVSYDMIQRSLPVFKELIKE